MKLLSLLFLFVIACDCPDQKEMMERRKQERIVQLKHDLGDRIEYYKDDRTDLCFAGMSLGFNAAVLTNVPCSLAVMESIQHFNSVKN